MMRAEGGQSRKHMRTQREAESIRGHEREDKVSSFQLNGGRKHGKCNPERRWPAWESHLVPHSAFDRNVLIASASEVVNTCSRSSPIHAHASEDKHATLGSMDESI